MKLHRVLAEGCVAVLDSAWTRGRVLERVLEEAFRANPRWGKRDRAFVAESVFEVTRWRRALAFVGDDEGIESLCAVQWWRMGFELPAWWRWRGVPTEEMTGREAALGDQPRAVRESVPDWLDQLGKEELGQRWDAELSALNCRAPITLRVNTLLGSRDEAAAWLAEAGVETDTIDDVPDALVVRQGRVAKGLVATGRVEIQDAGSQRIAPVLALEPGMKVIDACAGAGGKTLHVAALMRNEGRIVSLDVNQRKLLELERRVEAAGVPCVQTSLWDEDVLSQLAGWADRVLIDAPCSGLGTLRRQPDLKWRLSRESLGETIGVQARLLARYQSLVRKGGKLVYATCSILPSENEKQVAAFLAARPEWVEEETMLASPSRDHSDGLFAARLGTSPAVR